MSRKTVKVTAYSQANMSESKEEKKDVDFSLPPLPPKGLIDLSILPFGKKEVVLSKWDKDESLPGHSRGCELEEVDVGDGKKMVVAKTGAFKVKAQKILLTYKGHLNKSMVKNHFVKEFPKMVTCSDHFIGIAHETGKTTGVDYPHTHVLINFGYQIQKESFKWCLIEGHSHPNIRCVGTITHYKNAMRYLSKEDPENAHLVVAMPTLFEQMAGKSKADALGMCKRFSDVSGALLMQSLLPTKRYDPLEPGMVLSGFQSHIVSMIKGPPNDRDIAWFYNPSGGAGKSFLMKHLFASMPTDVLITNQVGSAKDCAHTIITAFEQGWNGKIFIVNLARDQQNFDGSLYKCLENIKDGMMFSTKYHGGGACWKPGHVLVMSNWLPRINALTIDRWHIWNVQNKGFKSEVNIVKMDAIDLLRSQSRERPITMDDKGYEGYYGQWGLPPPSK